MTKTTLSLALTLLALALPAASEAAAPLDLAVGQGRFFPGGQIASADVPDAGLCGVAGPCPEFQLKLAPGGGRLRVALDTPSREDGFQLDLIDPSGAVAASDAGSNVFDVEAFAKDPQPGVWTVRVLPQGATDAFFRLRAKLEGAPEPKGPKHMLLPNLKAVPPYEFGFAAPANPFNAAYPPDTVNPPLSAGGQEPVSCSADEMAPVSLEGGGATTCLRFTAGPINTGDGPFVKTFTLAQDIAEGKATPPVLRGPAHQRIEWSDGSTTLRDAGTYSFHKTHLHFHDDGILSYELFREDGDTLTPAGVGTKSGFCPADQHIGEWRRFVQDPAGTFGEGDTATGNCYGATDGAFTLTKGWGDVYRYQRPGQYVEFSGNGDGLYVVRATVDKSNTTLETSETDNSAYALIRVSGRRVEPIERGQGTSNLDPNKLVFTGFGPSSVDGIGGELPDPAAAAGPAPSAMGKGDTRAPRVTHVHVRGGRVTFHLSEAATVTLTVRRGTRVVRTVTVRGAAGANAVVVRRPALRSGRYRVGIVACDAAGNFSKAARTTVVRR